MSVRIHHSWLPLVGHQVEIRKQGTTLRKGTVDAVTVDDSILWLAAGDALEPRRMFQRSEGYQVCIDYKWESGQPSNLRVAA